MLSGRFQRDFGCFDGILMVCKAVLENSGYLHIFILSSADASMVLGPRATSRTLSKTDDNKKVLVITRWCPRLNGAGQAQWFKSAVVVILGPPALRAGAVRRARSSWSTPSWCTTSSTSAASSRSPAGDGSLHPRETSRRKRGRNQMVPTRLRGTPSGVRSSNDVHTYPEPAPLFEGSRFPIVHRVQDPDVCRR